MAAFSNLKIYTKTAKTGVWCRKIYTKPPFFTSQKMLTHSHPPKIIRTPEQL